MPDESLKEQQKEFLQARGIPDGIDVVDLQKMLSEFKEEKINKAYLARQHSVGTQRRMNSRRPSGFSRFLSGARNMLHFGSRYGVQFADNIYSLSKKGMHGLSQQMHDKSDLAVSTSSKDQIDKIDEWAANAEREINFDYRGPAKIVMNFGVAFKDVYKKIRLAFANPPRISQKQAEKPAEAKNELNKGNSKQKDDEVKDKQSAEKEALKPESNVRQRNIERLREMQEKLEHNAKTDSKSADKPSVPKNGKSDVKNNKPEIKDNLNNNSSKKERADEDKRETKKIDGDMLDVGTKKNDKLFLSNSEMQVLDTSIYQTEHGTGFDIQANPNSGSKEAIFNVAFKEDSGICFDGKTAIKNSTLSAWIRQNKKRPGFLRQQMRQVALNTIDDSMSQPNNGIYSINEALDKLSTDNKEKKQLVDNLNQHRIEELSSRKDQLGYFKRLPETASLYTTYLENYKGHSSVLDVKKLDIEHNLDAVTKDIVKDSKIPAKRREKDIKNVLLSDMLKRYVETGRMPLTPSSIESPLLSQGGKSYNAGKIVMRAMGVGEKNKKRLESLKQHNRQDPALANKLAFVGLDRKSGLPYKMSVSDINDEVTSVMHKEALKGTLDPGQLHNTNTKLFNEAVGHVLSGSGLDSGIEFIQQKYIASGHGREDLVKRAKDLEHAGKIKNVTPKLTPRQRNLANNFQHNGKQREAEKDKGMEL